MFAMHEDGLSGREQERERERGYSCVGSEVKRLCAMVTMAVRGLCEMVK